MLRMQKQLSGLLRVTLTMAGGQALEGVGQEVQEWVGVKGKTARGAVAGEAAKVQAGREQQPAVMALHQSPVLHLFLLMVKAKRRVRGGWRGSRVVLRRWRARRRRQENMAKQTSAGGFPP